MTFFTTPSTEETTRPHNSAHGDYLSIAALSFYIYASILTLLPSIPLWISNGQDAAFLFLTGDAYLYLGIAEHSTSDFFSFDGERPTNGFHPAWQYYLWLASQFVGDNSYLLMNIAALSNIILCWIGILLIGTAIYRATKSWMLSTVSTPGVYFLLVGQGWGTNLSVWDLFNGMENGLALALSGCVILLITFVKSSDERPIFWLSLGLLTGLLMFSRLDEIFVSFSIGLVWLFWTRTSLFRRLRSVFLLGILPGLILIAYLAYNLSYMNVAMPISGAAKGEGALFQNIWVTSANLFAPFIDLRALVSDYNPAYSAIGGAGFRVAQLIVPAIFASFFLVYFSSSNLRNNPISPLIAGMSLAIIFKFGYNFAFVGYWHQASWYFSFAMATISFSTAVFLGNTYHKCRQANFLGTLLVFLLIFVVSFQQASNIYHSKANTVATSDRKLFFDNRFNINAEITGTVGDWGIFEFGDGIINFSLDRPVRHGFVFAGDVQTLADLHANTLLQGAFESGYRVLSSFEYFVWPDASLEKSSDEIREFLATRGASYAIRSELDRFNFEVIYVYEPLMIPFISFSPKLN